MTIDDRLRALEESGADPALLRAIRLLIEQRDGEAKAHGTFSAAWRQSVIDRYNAAVLSAMDGW